MLRRWGSQQLKLFGINATIVVMTICLMATACVLCVTNEITDRRVFARGVSVDEMDLSGMTFAEAKMGLSKKCSESVSDVTVIVSLDGKDYTYSGIELGLHSNLEGVLEKAFAIGKTVSNGDYLISSDSLKLKTGYAVDEEVMKETLRELAVLLDKEPIEPCAVMDKQDRTFSYAEGKVGYEVAIQSNVEALVSRLSVGDFSTYTLKTDVVKPKMTVDELKNNITRVASYTTLTSDNFNRNTNISLMCSYINGCMIMPGEILSINALVGERTAKKGFLPAPAIMDGKRLENDLGGGICQVSGTLYNSALLANMGIVERLPHSWPSDYVPVGLDSTLDWNTQKDLKLQNTTDYPVYIAAWLENDSLQGENALHVEIYGQPLPSGVSIKIRSEIVDTIYPDGTVKKHVSTMTSGSTKVVTRARIGYKTEVWRDFYLNGKLIDSEPMSPSYYRPIRGEILVGTGGETHNTQSPQTSPVQLEDPTPTPTSETMPLETLTPTLP